MKHCKEPLAIMEENTGVKKPEQEAPVVKKGRGYGLITFISFIVIPVCIFSVIIYSLLTSSLFYTNILKNADLISTYIHARNWQMEEDIKDEIDREVHLDSFREEYRRIKARHESARELYRRLNRSDEYEKLERMRKELDSLSWKRAPKAFSSEKAFEDYKRKELEKADDMLGKIESYRDEKKDEIKTARNSFKKAEDAFEDAAETLEDREKDAREIILSHENSFMGKIYSDVELINDPLTKILNEKLIDGAVKNEIEKLIRFFTSYGEQVIKGNVFRDRFVITGDRISDLLKVQLPRISISLWVEDEVNGVLQKRHLLSQVFVDAVEKIDGLSNRELFTKFFRFSETGLAERIGRSYMKKAGLSIRQGVIIIRPVAFGGRDARTVETVMKAATLGHSARYVLPAAAFILFLIMLVYPADRKRKIRNVRRVLVYPSLFVIIVCIAAVVISWSGVLFRPGAISSPYTLMYMKKMLLLVSTRLLVPVAGAFAVVALLGSFFRSHKKKSVTE